MPDLKMPAFLIVKSVLLGQERQSAEYWQQPLSLIARGADEVIGRSIQPDGHGRYQVIGLLSELYGEEHHFFDLFTPPDFVYIVSVVLSTLAIFLSFDSIWRPGLHEHAGQGRRGGSV